MADKSAYPQLKLTFYENCKVPFLHSACFKKAEGEDGSTTLYDDPPGPKILTATCILILLSKYKGVSTDPLYIYFRENFKKLSWLNSLALDDDKLKEHFDDYFQQFPFFDATRAEDGKVGTLVKFHHQQLKLENIFLSKINPTKKGSSDRPLSRKDLHVFAGMLEANFTGKEWKNPWVKSVNEHIRRIDESKANGETIGDIGAIESTNHSATPTIFSPLWLDVFEEAFKEIEAKGLAGNWYAVCGTPKYLVRYDRAFCNAVRRGANVKFAHYSLEAPDKCLSVAAQWKMNAEPLNLVDPIAQLKERMKDGIAEITHWAYEAAKEQSKGRFEFFQSLIAHPYVCVLVVPNHASKEGQPEKRAPVGTVCMLCTQTFYPGSITNRLGMYFNQSGPVLDIFYRSIVDFFGKGTRAGYLIPDDYLAARDKKMNQSAEPSLAATLSGIAGGDAFGVEAQTPLSIWLSKSEDDTKKKQLLKEFCPSFAAHPEEVTQLGDYFRWNYEPSLWKLGEGDLYGTSYREFLTFWSNPQLYQIQEAALFRYRKAGGTVNRIIVIDEEFFNPKLKALLLRTGLRQTILGLEPLITDSAGMNSVFVRLGVKCDMIGLANNRIAYFLRASDPAPCFVRTYDKTYINKTRTAYLELVKKGQMFGEWAKKTGVSAQLAVLRAEVEAEAELIGNYANSWDEFAGKPFQQQKRRS